MLKRNGCAIVLALVCVFIVSMTIYGNKFASAQKDRVILRGFPGNGTVQMFDTLTSDARVISEQPDETICAKIGGPFDGSEAGISMSFYRLNCGGMVGYVNVRWATR